MDESNRSDAELRRRRNLQAVYGHHARKAEEASLDPSRAQVSSGTKNFLARFGWIGVVLAFVLGKGKLLIPLLKFTKLGTLVTMFLAIGVYAQIWGVWFAIGFVLLIFVHELGHALVMKQQGIRAGPPVFIPFVGAVIAMKSLPKDAYVEALVGIGGPILGSAGALVCYGIGLVTGNTYWFALAWTGFMLNLFNLIPVSPLDGGRIVGVVSRWLWVVGYVVGAVVFWKTQSPLLMLILLVGLFGLGRAFRGHGDAYFDVPASRRVAMGAAYFALVGLLTLGMSIADRRLEHLYDQSVVPDESAGVGATSTAAAPVGAQIAVLLEEPVSGS